MCLPTRHTALWLGRALVLGLAVAGVLALVGAVAAVEQPQSDFQLTYWSHLRAWLFSGQALYRDAHFFNPPWTAFLLAPFVVGSAAVGRALLAVCSLLVSIVAVLTFASPQTWHRRVSVILAVCSFSVLQPALVGQVDLFPLLGAVLAWHGLRCPHSVLLPWPSPAPREQVRGEGEGHRRLVRAVLLAVALVLLAVKPHVTFLLMLTVLLALRAASARERGIVLGIPLLSMAAASVAVGLDWPLRWWEMYQARPPLEHFTVTTWRAAAHLGIPTTVAALAVAVVLARTCVVLLRRPVTQDIIALALLGDALATIYASPSSGLLTMAVAFPRAFAARPWLTLAAYPLSFTALLRQVSLLHPDPTLEVFTSGWTDICFPWALWLLLAVPGLPARAVLTPAAPATREKAQGESRFPAARAAPTARGRGNPFRGRMYGRRQNALAPRRARVGSGRGLGERRSVPEMNNSPL